jgi:hypothetical protein
MSDELFSCEMASQIEIAGTITKLPPSVAGKVIISGSHGGKLPGGLAIRAGGRAVILNDAGCGLDDAGIGSLELCQGFGMAAATVSHNSCRIGDANDMVLRGIISHANKIALDARVTIGQPCKQAAEILTKAPLPNFNEPPHFLENREVLTLDGAKRTFIMVDSASMVILEDADQVVLTGSHGGLIGNNPKYAIKTPVYAAFYNDAGVGFEQWGVTRLPALQDLGIAGITLDCMTCRIGDAASAYATGIVSAVNNRAQEFGVQVGITAHEAVRILCG